MAVKEMMHHALRCDNVKRPIKPMVSFDSNFLRLCDGNPISTDSQRTVWVHAFSISSLHPLVSRRLFFVLESSLTSFLATRRKLFSRQQLVFTEAYLPAVLIDTIRQTYQIALADGPRIRIHARC